MEKPYSFFFYCFIPDSVFFRLNKIYRGEKNSVTQYILLVLSALFLYRLVFREFILYET